MSEPATADEQHPPVDLESVRQQWLGVEFEWAEFEMLAEDMVDWAVACGEDDPRFTDPSHPDFQAHPSFTTHCMSKRALPEGFAQIGDGFGIDGGKTVEAHAPIRPGETLRGVATIAEVYDKTGRSGTMVFIVQRMTFSNESDEKVSTVDWKMIRRA